MRFFRRAETANDFPRFATLLAMLFPRAHSYHPPIRSVASQGALPSVNVLVGNMADRREMHCGELISERWRGP